MNCLESNLDVNNYLSALKNCRTGGYPIFTEGVTGTFIGQFFSVAYYSPYEWNRRITHECNRAWGYVKEHNGKTKVYFVRGKGFLTPFWVLVYWFACYLIFLFSLAADVMVTEEPMFLLVALILSLFICFISAAGSFFTDAGIAGENEILRMLQNPEDYYC